MASPRSAVRRTLDAALDVLALTGGWALLGLSILVAGEVLLRKFFAYSIKGVDELGGYVLAVASAIGFVYALVQHAHIRVDIAFRFFGPRLRATLHLLAYVTMAAFAALLAWRAAAVLLRSVSLDAIAPTPLGTPLVIPQSIWVAGLVAFAAVAVGLTVDLVRKLLRDGAAEVDRHFHADRLDEEFEAERQDAERRRTQ